MATRRRGDVFQVHEGGLRIRLGEGHVRVQLVSGNEAPAPSEATVIEEDTHLVLSAPAVLPREPEHPIRVMTALVEARPRVPGTVVVSGKAPPYRLLAIVHDVDQSPTWRPEWIASALAAALGAAGERSLRTLALPVLGSRHGGMRPLEFAGLLGAALAALESSSLETIWLLLPPTSPVERRAIERILLEASVRP